MRQQLKLCATDCVHPEVGAAVCAQRCWCLEPRAGQAQATHSRCSVSDQRIVHSLPLQAVFGSPAECFSGVGCCISSLRQH
jgi:hypothetical protein